MVIRSVNLETVCGITSILPDNPCDEVAFAGKSNVGKSSLINALVNRKALARTSSQPGKTQTINFYRVNDAVYLVDLPGYGYATAGVEIKAKWGRMVEHYLDSSKKLKAVFLLIDIRHDPSENDRIMHDWILANGFEPIIIATKADKLKRSQVAGHVQRIREVLKLQEGTPVVPFSAETKEGREEIWALIESVAGLTGDGALQGNTPGGALQGKPRWKASGHPVAKKTKRKERKKKDKKKKKKERKKKPDGL